ncbi:MAG: hypothetical protein JPMHGGIA_00264 [Saprospiraceae bacterium]|jgi:hypothetical protein|nr:hypothetical protein [Saprospiraceae bacterium]
MYHFKQILKSHFESKLLLTKILWILLAFTSTLSAQGVTTSSIGGSVRDEQGQPLLGATVRAIHVPSGTIYGAITNDNGRFLIQGVRIGGPFRIVVTYLGFEENVSENLVTNLGVTTNHNVRMLQSNVGLEEVVVTEVRGGIFSSERTGASTTFGNEIVNALPNSGSRSITSITKYNPNGDGKSFGAQDSRLNNFTIDGSVFNNAFGLGSESQAGGRTGSTAISLDAIQEIQVNVAPFDVRQSGFVGSGLNAVTRSGTNRFQGSAFYNFRNNDLQGARAGDNRVASTQFEEIIMGLRLGGPIIKDKLFFFVSAETVEKTEPATSYVANGSSNPGTTTRVEKADLDNLSLFLKEKYNYVTGPYENFNNATTSEKFLARLDYNLNLKNKLSLRYIHHDSQSDQLISDSRSLGAGDRRTRIDAMAYQNSGYAIQDNTRSIVGEWNSSLTNSLFNKLVVGYDYQNEDRKTNVDVFPTVDILKDNKTYISFGYDPFTPSNNLNYNTLHLTNDLSYSRGKHNFTFGVNYEHYKSNNLFFPGSNGVYVFNSLEDFYAAANSDADTSPVTINKFQFRYSALEGAADPLQILQINRFDAYIQDEYQINDRFVVSAGIRGNYIVFDQTALENTVISGQTYVDPLGSRDYKINTGKLPDAKILLEPRLGFNYRTGSDNQIQVRGGTGVFTGKPPYVWVSNQVGNNGILTGFIQADNSRAFRFTPNVSEFIPSTPTLPSTFDIAATDNDYKFPQVWKSDLALDYRLPFGAIATVELMYNKNVNAVRYFDANLEPAADTAKFKGPDTRSRFPGSYVSGSQVNAATRVNDNVARAAVMTTTDEGFYRALTLKLELPNWRGLSAMLAYTRSEAKDLMSAGSIASGSFTGLRTVEGNNKPELSWSNFDIPHRLIGYLGYRLEYGGERGGATQVYLSYAGAQSARYSYVYAGDMNGDGIQNNDLLFVPQKGSDLSWEEYTVTQSNGTKTTFTATDQAAAFDAFIEQSDYLREKRGGYSERNGLLYPWLHRFDLSFVQEFYLTIGERKNTLQLRLDMFNVGNFINSDWGVGNTLITDRPLSFRKVVDGVPVYRLATQNINGTTSLIRDALVSSASGSDVWQAQVGIRYIF